MRILAFLVLLASAYSPAGKTSDDVIGAGDFDFKIALGVGQVITPIATEDNSALFLLPSLSWYGEKFYFEDGLLGFALDEQPHQQFDLVMYPGADGLLFWYTQDNPLAPGGVIPSPMPVNPPFEVRGVEKRYVAVHAGLRFAQQFDDMYWHAIVGKDISRVHYGWNLSVALGDDAIYRRGDLTIGAELALSYRSAALVDYYYDNRFDEILPLDYVYEGEGDLSVQMQLRASYQLDKNWSAIARYGHHWLGDSVNSSPLIDRRDTRVWFTGLQYGF